MPLLNPISSSIQYEYQRIDCIERIKSSVAFETKKQENEIENFYDQYLESIGYKYHIGSYYGGSSYSDTFIIQIKGKNAKENTREVTIKYIN
ncbi:MAG: hypothetical protein AAGA80_25065 [Cyanobacteria bacterium P01_F01_bin.143]